MGYAGFTRRFFLAPFAAAGEAPERAPAVEAMLKRRIVHVASLNLLLIFCKRLSSAPLPFGRLNP
jgi:hypothetical protein